MEINPITRLPTGFKGTMTFSEPGRQACDPKLSSVDRLLELANVALSEANFQAWVLLIGSMWHLQRTQNLRITLSAHFSVSTLTS